ncbi:MAG TPA: hypothetical protein VMZ53_18785 [Kofleriaceae bacterium]|nr:hypothetical protein [Kofleriaceae bacterium]
MRAATLLALCVSSAAYAQAPAPDAPPPGSSDPVLDEQIAQQLVDRAQELLDAKLWLDAKQLAVEARVKSPKGPSAERARYIINIVNQHLDIKEEPPPTPPSEVPPTTTPPTATPDIPQVGDRINPFEPPAKDPEEPPPATPPGNGNPRTAAMIHGGLYGATIGTTIGVAANSDNPAAAAIPLGIVGGVGVGYLSTKLVARAHWDEAQVRTAGSYSTWGSAIGGLFGGAATGAGDSSPSATGVLVGASIGSTIGAGVGIAFARTHKFTRGDVALTDTLAGIGAVGGLTLGMLMQPVQPEAYAVNSIVGISAGLVVGLVAGPQTNTTPRRMLRVAGLSAAGGAAPFLLYAAIYDSSSASDERVTGLLSSAGLVVGAYLGFRITAKMDEGVDKADAPPDDAPIALVGRSSNGNWALGGIGVQPLSRQLATNNRGMTFTVVGATF